MSVQNKVCPFKIEDVHSKQRMFIQNRGCSFIIEDVSKSRRMFTHNRGCIIGSEEKNVTLKEENLYSYIKNYGGIPVWWTAPNLILNILFQRILS